MQNSITKGQIKLIYGMLRNSGLVDNKEEIVSQFTAERTTHISEMHREEADNMAAYLIENTVTVTNVQKTMNNTKRGINRHPKSEKMRRKILHVLALNGFLDANGKFDYKRIDAFIKGIGSRNPHKVGINYLSNDELVSIITQIEKMVFKNIV